MKRTNRLAREKSPYLLQHAHNPVDWFPWGNEAWRMRREEVLHSADEVIAAVDRGRPRARAGSGDSLSETTLDEAFHELAADFDETRGGFGGAPKFPIPHHIGFLLRYWKRTGRAEALTMAEKTLAAMRLGGIYDHLGFGFHRYSTDAGWLVPHFEKMLYDQALLAEVYAEAFAATGKSEFKRTAEEVVEYVLRDLTSPEGGFSTAEDADSEGEEGKFYLWTTDELGDVLGPEEAKLAARIYGLEAGGNFSEPGKSRDGRNILHRGRTAEGPVPEARLAPEEPAVRFEKIRRKLFLAREGRVRPFKDTKVLADWNGLTIAALASVFRITSEDRYLRAAERATDFVLERMRAPDGRLLHVFADGEARVPAFLDDYAFLVKGLVGLYEAGFDPGHLEKALELARRTVELLWDEKEGGFFFAATEPEVGARRKEIHDGQGRDGAGPRTPRPLYQGHGRSRRPRRRLRLLGRYLPPPRLVRRRTP